MNHEMSSIIIPVYNGAKYLKETLESCLAQNGLFEIILVEDASSDESLEILQAYQYQNVEVVRIIKHTENKGFVCGIIDGINIARGDYISVLGQDDLMFPGRLQHLIQRLKEVQASMICSNAFYLFNETPSNVLVRPKWLETGFIPKNAYLFQNPVIGSSVMFKKRDFQRINFSNYPYRNSIEWYHWFNYACMKGTYFIAEPLVYYRKHTSNISTTLFQSAEYKSYKTFCRKFIVSRLNLMDIIMAVRNKILRKGSLVTTTK